MTVLHEGNLFLSHVNNERHEEYLQSTLQALDSDTERQNRTHSWIWDT